MMLKNPFLQFIVCIVFALIPVKGSAGQQQPAAGDEQHAGKQAAGTTKKKAAEPKTDAERYAAELAKFVNSVVEQIGARMKVEQTYYDNTSASYTANFRRYVLDGLASARYER